MKFNIVFGIVNLILLFTVISLLPPYPLDNSIIYERYPSFWSLGKSTLILSKEKDLSNPVLEENFENKYKVKEKLEFDTYYWKIIKENIETKVRKFTVESKVATSIKANKLTNEGNTIVNVLPGITGAAIVELEPQGYLQINQSKKIIYEVSQNE